MKIAAYLAAAALIQQPTGCNQSSIPVAQEHHGPPIHRFENVSSPGATGVALDTMTGRLCKTWNWVYKSDAMSGGLDTLPTCLSLYSQTDSAPDSK